MKTTAPMSAIASDTITPTSTNGENRLRCADRGLKGLRRSFRIITYLYLHYLCVLCRESADITILGNGHSNAELPQLGKHLVTMLLNPARHTPKQVPVLFASSR
jgi:hypothetical protein